jgi:predicted GNAT family N-acyltransferase
VIARLATAEDMPAALALRHEVFVIGQDVPEDLERDDMDAVSDHAVAIVDGTVVGTGRLTPDGTIGRIAVSDALRGKGIGAAVLTVLEDQAEARGLSAVELHAQVHALGFYDRYGYVPCSEVYLEAGIQHQSMRKELS